MNETSNHNSSATNRNRSSRTDDPSEILRNGDRSARKRKRDGREWRFRLYTIIALLLAAGFVVFFLYDLINTGYSALWQAEVRTSVTYSPETVKNPKQAFPGEVRDLISHAKVRKIQRAGQIPFVRVPVHYGKASVEHPERAIQPLTLEKDEFPIYMQDTGPVEIPRKHLLNMISPEAMTSIRETLRDASQTGRREEKFTGAKAIQNYMISRKDHPLPDGLKDSVENMIKTGRIEMTYNRERFGDGKTMKKEWVVLDADVDQYLKGNYSQISYRADAYAQLMNELGREPVPDPDVEKLMEEIESQDLNASVETEGKMTEEEMTIDVDSTERLRELIGGWETARRVDRLEKEGRIALHFNDYFFLRGDSKIPEVAGMRIAVIGSVMVLFVVLITAVPIGVMTAVFLEEFAPDNWLTQFIEININNLAAIPSILYGVLGLAFFINMMNIPRSSVLVGGLTLALMTLPIVIISARSALRAVPDSIRMAGFSMGATRWQVVLHHVLPESLTGILTGSIIGLAQAMGETAPLILIGLVGFFSSAPTSLTDSTTVMPAQIYSWWGMPQRAFQSRAALAILLLLVVLFAMNGFAVVLRARAQEAGS